RRQLSSCSEPTQKVHHHDGRRFPHMVLRPVHARRARPASTSRGSPRLGCRQLRPRVRTRGLADHAPARDDAGELLDRDEGSLGRRTMQEGSDESLWFKINEDKGGEVLYFKRRGGKLWKLGDGTFGVVYVVHSELRDNDFAVKLLYDNESTTPRSLSRLPVE